MKTLLVVLFSAIPLVTLAQEAVEQQPQYPGGLDGLLAVINENIVYPELAQENNVEGTVFVQFTVTAEGTMEDITVARGVSKELDAEALRVVALLGEWEPGTRDGKPVDVRYNLPLKFKLEEKKKDTDKERK